MRTLKKWNVDELLVFALILPIPVISMRMENNWIETYNPSICTSTSSLYTRKFFNIYIEDTATTSASTYLNIYNPGSVSNLEIVNASIATVPPSFFRQFYNIRECRLVNINISKIIPGAFTSLNNLNCLDVSANNISYIQDGIFNGLHSLTFLNLSLNNIRNISEHAFKGLTNLRELYLQENKIMAIHSNLFLSQIDSLRVLNVSSNKLVEIHNAVKNMNLLQDLYLTNNEVKDINLTIVSAKKLYLKGNKLSSIKPVRKSMEAIDLSYNVVENIEENVFANSYLKEIYLGHNSISYIHKKLLFGLLNLTHLHLEFNKISSLPNSCFRDLIHLEYLDLSHNRIRKLQYGIFDRVQSLLFLNISYNGFKSFNEGILSRQVVLRALHINNNEIQYINTLKLKMYCPNLDKINLDGNFWKCEQLIGMIRDFEERRSEVVVKGTCFESDNVKGISCNAGDDLSTRSLYNMKNNSDTAVGGNTEIAELTEFFKKDFMKTPFYNYFNRDFENSNFFSYLENLKNPQVIVAKTENLNESNIQSLISTVGTQKSELDINKIYIILTMNMVGLIVIIVLIVYFICRYKLKKSFAENVELM